MSIRFSSMCSTRPCWAPIAAEIVGSMSCASVTAANGTQKTPPVNRSTDSAAAWSASRVLPEPPAPVNVTMRAPSMSAAMSRSSSVRPTSGSSWAGRFVALSERRGGNRSQPSWNSLSGAPRSLSRCSPRSRPGSRSSAARVTSESTTCPPWAAAQILAARWTSMPTYPSVVTIGVPVWMPMRTRTGPSDRWISSAAATASSARPKATKNASPCVSTSTPSCRPKTARSSLRWPASRSAYPSPRSCRSRVEPSMSVNRKVTVPDGRSRVIGPREGRPGGSGRTAGPDRRSGRPPMSWPGTR